MALANTSRKQKRVTVNGMLFDLQIAEPTDWYIDHFRSLPGGKDRMLFQRAMPTGATVFDIGANAGYYSIPFARAIGASGQVHAFEPSPLMMRRLKANAKLNSTSNICFHPVALGNSTGRSELHFPEDGDPGSASLAQGQHVPSCVDQIEVDVRRLDDYVSSRGIRDVQFIKIDVEGFEVKVLQGAREVINRCRPRLLVEVYEDALHSAGSSRAELLRLLKSMNYGLYKNMLGRRDLVRIGPHDKLGRIFDIHAIPIDGAVK